ncbi:conserved exported hypothetical protein [Methylocella tundrae]|uniref:DUF4142 domain-containing protein n=1 Tax=Methylocella tundrae TaxID=227605 RepID=A0A8B6MAN6_METTU|nr:conserved exported hypothetical protein [Methylocella tundrae]
MSAKGARTRLIAASALIAAAVAPLKAQTATAPDAPPIAAGRNLPSSLEQSAAFIGDAFPSIHFLDQASRMAIAHSKNDKIRDFAEHVAQDETSVGNSLMHWVRTGGAGAADETSPSNRLAIGIKPPRMLASQANFLQHLSGLQGHDFDVMYVSIEKDALQNLASVYELYVRNGLDPGLQAIATRELPEVKHLISVLASL